MTTFIIGQFGGFQMADSKNVFLAISVLSDRAITFSGPVKFNNNKIIK
jgi:hypothetical protein